jgi:hypothetical protein
VTTRLFATATWMGCLLLLAPPTRGDAPPGGGCAPAEALAPAPNTSHGGVRAAEVARADGAAGGAGGADAAGEDEAATERSPNTTGVNDPPPFESIRPGVDGAAQILALGQIERAREHLDALAISPGDPSFARAMVIRGRVERLRGDLQLSVTALEGALASEEAREVVPLDILAFELVRARRGWITSGTIDEVAADAQRRLALSEIERALDVDDVRIARPLRVARAELLGELATRDVKLRAKAIRELDRVFENYPYHVDAGSWALRAAELLAASTKKRDRKAAVARLRVLIQDRPGTAAAALAETQLGALQAAGFRGAATFSREERLARAMQARTLRNLDTAIAEANVLLDDPSTPRHARIAALVDRAWSRYVARDYAGCVADHEAIEAMGHPVQRDDRLRCLERAERYDTLLTRFASVHEDRKASKTRAVGARAEAIEIAIRAGRYGTARELLAAQELATPKAISAGRRWLRAMLADRTGDRDAALLAYDAITDGPYAARARYFAAKLRLASANPTTKASGEATLREIAEKDSIGYWGLQARAALAHEGIDVPPPDLSPSRFETERAGLSHREVSDTFAALRDVAGEGWPALDRARALYDVGYRDEAKRELRWVVDAWLETYGEGPRLSRTEELEVGLGWAVEWDPPKARLPAPVRQRLRDDALRAAARDHLVTLLRGLDEPYRLARLATSADGSYRARWSPRAYRALVERHAAEHGFPPSHLWALMYTESRFRPHVVSHVGARGAVQIMPWTYRQLRARAGEDTSRVDPDDLFDVETNVRWAAIYFAALLEEFDGQAPLAYAAYNAGPTSVRRWVVAKTAEGRTLDMDAFIAEIPFDETQRYVRRVLEMEATYRLLYEGELPKWPKTVSGKVARSIDF